MTGPIDLAAKRVRRPARLAAPNVPAGLAIAAPPAPPLRNWDVDGVATFTAERGPGPRTAIVRLSIEMDPTAGRWRVAIAREGSKTLVLQDGPRAGDGTVGAAARGGIMDFLNDVLSASFLDVLSASSPVVDGADSLLPFRRREPR